MKTINLNRVTNTLSDGEMKLVKGGLDYPMVDNGSGGSGAFAACSQPDSCDTGTRMCWTLTNGDGYCKRDIADNNKCKCLP